MKNLFLTTTICLIGLSTLAQTAVQGQDKILSSLNKRNLKYISSQEFPLKRNMQFNQPFLSILVIQDSIDFFKKGYIDGGIYYTDTGSFWTGFALVFVGFPGLILTIVISKKPPTNLGNSKNPSNELLLSNSLYYDGFQSAAKKRKKRKTWTGYGVGTGFIITIAIVIFSNLSLP